MTDNALYNISVLTLVFTCMLNLGPSDFFLLSNKQVCKDIIPILPVDYINHEL